MNSDYTQRQTVGEQMRAEELSLRATIPPAEVTGYRLERLLGQGAFGQVWVGKNLNTGRTVAVKFYLHRGGVDWSLLAREVKHLVSMAANRFIVQVLEVGWDAEPPYYVMEYLENGSLDDLIRSRGSLGVAQASHLFGDIAAGLNHSHGKGVLHCDLKPANVLLDQDMRPRLADFGQSRMSHEQTPSLGTLFYMAPEQADLNAVPDARWDVYALGAILYCMLCGFPPYRTPQMVNTLDTAASLPDRLKRYREAILQSPPPKQHYRVRGMDRELASIIDRCLSKNPEDRLANVQQVLESLEKRQISRARKPLMLLGIVGPVLLLSVMAFFSLRGLSVAQTESAGEIRDWSIRSNEFAAKLAAQSIESEFANLFQELGQVVNESFRKKLNRVLTDAGDTTLRSLAVETAPEDIIAKFRSLPSQDDLQDHLKRTLQKWMSEKENLSNPAKFSSLFVVDAHGTNLAIAINEAMDEDPVGRNFAYRTYYNGYHKDLEPSVDRSGIRPITFQFVSPTFISTSTGRAKIAICKPLFETDDESSKEVLGLLVLTINIGDFQDLTRRTFAEENAETAKEDRFAVLINGTDGRIIQHPLLRRLDRQTTLEFKIDEDQFSRLKKRGIFGYVDPVSLNELGKEYEGDWIAALERVDIARRAGLGSSEDNRTATDLWVLVKKKPIR